MSAFDFSTIFGIGLVATFIATATGGSGLIIIPGLIFMGLSPQTAIATDQIGLVGESLAGWLALHRAKKIDYRLALWLSVLAGAGAALGASILVRLHGGVVEKLIGVLVLLAGTAVYRNKRVGTESAELKVALKIVAVAYCLYFVVGVWGGMLGAGFGFLSRYVLLFGFRKSMLECAGVSKLTSLAIASAAIPIFIRSDLINWVATVPLLGGTMLGSLLGTHYALRIGDEKLRTLFLVMVVISGIKLLVF